MTPSALKQYEIVAQEIPRKKGEVQEKVDLIKHTVFAKDIVQARSRFWKEMTQMVKMKKSRGKIVAERLVDDYSSDKIRNFGIHVRYKLKGKGYDAYKEFRALSLSEAVGELYADLKSRHGVKKETVQIVNAKEVSDEDVKREKVKRFCKDGIEFGHMFLNKRHINKKYKKNLVDVDS